MRGKRKLDPKEKEVPESELPEESKFVMSTICAYSKAPELTPLRDRSAKAVAQAF